MSKTVSDIFISALLSIVLFVFAIQLPKIPQGARVYPIVLLIASACLVISYLVISVKKYKNEDKAEKVQTDSSQLKLILSYIIFIGIYILLMDKIGYIISTYLFVLLSLLYLKVKSKKVLIILPIAITLVVYFAFTNILIVMLPRGTWLPF